ncbi:sensor histidine kinase, partial [Romboutsia sp. 13368]|uniref:sensor histidine kinase n=1 Tax=Romboutsia sp. 13368 TaxID=2708053 RepID=UPI0025F813A9
IPKNSIIINKPVYGLLIPKSLKLVVYLGTSLIIAIGFYVVYILISEKRKSIKNRKLYENAKEREKLKTDFIVNMSHELRTPLNVILSTSKVMDLKINKNNYDNEYLLEKLEQINKNSNRLLKLVNNLIDITKFEYGSYELKLENINIVEVVEDIVQASVDYSTCKDIDLIFDTEDEEIITAIDKDKIERVILNLLSNAIKFTDKDGIIYVYIKRIDNSVSISVQDNGIGIPKDKLDEIFNRFYQVSDTLKKHEEGSGIGLCIVEEIINLHGGKINVTSKVNEGTNFEIILPIYIVENSFKSVEIKDINQSVKLEMSDVDTKEV